MSFDQLLMCSCGNPMGSIKIYLKPLSGPFEAIAEVERCAFCNKVCKISPIRNKNGITVYQIEKCYRQMTINFFTLEELRSGIVHGALKDVKAPTMPGSNYDPDKFLGERDTQGVF